MQFNMSDPNPPVRVFVKKGHEDPGKDPFLDLRPATSSVLKEIREATHTKRLQNVRGVVHETWDVDEEQYDRMLWEYCMPGFGNLKDENGNCIEYSLENVLFLLDIPYFSDLVASKMDEAKLTIEKRIMASEKN